MNVFESIIFYAKLNNLLKNLSSISTFYFQDKLKSVPFCKDGDSGGGSGSGIDVLGIDGYKFDCKAAVGYLAVYRYNIGILDTK